MGALTSLHTLVNGFRIICRVLPHATAPQGHQRVQCLPGQRRRDDQAVGVLPLVLDSNGLALAIRPLVADRLVVDLKHRLCILDEGRKAEPLLAVLPRPVDGQDPPLLTAGEARLLKA